MRSDFRNKKEHSLQEREQSLDAAELRGDSKERMQRLVPKYSAKVGETSHQHSKTTLPELFK